MFMLDRRRSLEASNFPPLDNREGDSVDADETGRLRGEEPGDDESRRDGDCIMATSFFGVDAEWVAVECQITGILNDKSPSVQTINVVQPCKQEMRIKFGPFASVCLLFFQPETISNIERRLSRPCTCRYFL